MKDNLIVEMYGDPDIDVREIFPKEQKLKIKLFNKKPFIARQRAILKIAYINKKGELYTTAFRNPQNYEYDGATIPFGIGKGNMKLLIPALWHDFMCEHKEKINFNRYLSSLVFRELLIQCGDNKFSANIKFLAVDNWQKLQRGWKFK